MKHIFVRQNICEPVKYLSFLSNGKAMNFLLEGVHSQDKSALMNIDLFKRNVNIKRLIVALPCDKLSTKFF